MNYENRNVDLLEWGSILQRRPYLYHNKAWIVTSNHHKVKTGVVTHHQ